MAQGAIKKKAPKSTTSASASAKTKSALGPKRGTNRVIAPKKAKLRKERALVKKHSGALTALTERNLAQKAGHLEMLGGGKRDSKAGKEMKGGGKGGRRKGGR